MSLRRISVVVALAAGLAGCGGAASTSASAGGGAAGRGRGGAQVMPVQVTPVHPVTVSNATTYVGSIESLQSTVVSAQVGGILQDILVHSGDMVKAGQTLMHINAATQQAQVSNLVNSRASVAATLSFDRQQLSRAQQLYQDKIGTLQDYQSAQAAVNAAQAQLNALDAQIRQARVTLSYYSVAAPTAGIVGDIPVRVGDQVAIGTQLTTIDSGRDMEVYTQVPIAEAGRLRIGLPITVEDTQGDVIARTRVRFVSPQVDNQTQSILVKAPIADPAHPVRTHEYVQAVITWGTHSALVVPVLSVVQEGDRAFVYLLTPRGSGFYAHEVPVTLGQITGNDYEVTGGLKAGDRVITSTTQMLADGEPVMPLPAGGRGGAGAAGPGAGR